jgi:5-methylcytosine-specific restriction endonuclease McrA
MPFVEDLSTTTRGALSPRRRLAVWEKTGGICVVCERRIDGARERWIAEHIRALELGGADALDNLGPAHDACARSKTQDDHQRAARAKRQKIRHLGAERPKRPLPCGRRSRFKRKLTGEIVLR